MRTAIRAAALVVIALGVSCQDDPLPRDQWLVVIGTDAAVPQFGDRLLIEVVDERGEVCSACREQFGVDEDTWPMTLGIVSDGTPRGVRARLYRTSITGEDGFPASDRHLDAYARLPEALGVTRVGLELRMACFGVAADPAAGTSCDPATGASAAARVLEVIDGDPEVPMPGSWPLAGPDGCDGVEPPPGMVCVPGGTFLLGSPGAIALIDVASTLPEQLVRVSPFFIDVEELTVGAIRPAVESGAVSAPSTGGAGYCTWGRGDDLPVNCVGWDLASRLCEVLGKRLPTEAEWEYAAVNQHLETRFPWLDEEVDPCAQAVIDLGTVAGDAGRCLPSGDPDAPVAGGSRLDVTLAGVFNLGGNLSEWVQDDFVGLADPTCWGPSPVLHEDPRCVAATILGQKTIKGGSWEKNPNQMEGANRNAAPGGSAGLGLRCVQPL